VAGSGGSSQNTLGAGPPTPSEGAGLWVAIISTVVGGKTGRGGWTKSEGAEPPPLDPGLEPPLMAGWATGTPQKLCGPRTTYYHPEQRDSYRNVIKLQI